jgi:hypothetical protein
MKKIFNFAILILIISTVFCIEIEVETENQTQTEKPNVIACSQDKDCLFSDIFLPKATAQPGRNFSFTLLTKNFNNTNNLTTYVNAYLFAKQPQRHSMNFLGILLGAEYVGPVALNLTIEANSRKHVDFLIPQWIQPSGELIVVLIQDKQLQGEFRVKLEKMEQPKLTRFNIKPIKNIIEYCEELKRKNLIKFELHEKLCKIANDELILRKREFLFLGINNETGSNSIFKDL